MFTDRLETIQSAQRLRLRQDRIVSASGTSQQRVSEFFGHKRLAEGASRKIKATIEMIGYLWDRRKGLEVYPQSPAELQEAYEFARWLEASGTDKKIERLIFTSQAPQVSTHSDKHAE